MSDNKSSTNVHFYIQSMLSRWNHWNH